MTVFSNNMTITDSSLSNISKELINKKIYKNGSLTIVGNPIIANSSARNISDENYFKKTGLHFTPYNLTKITFSGVIGDLPVATKHCAWKLYKGTI